MTPDEDELRGTGRIALVEEVLRLRDDRRRALRLANELTLETQTCAEAVADLLRQLREARAGYQQLDANWAALHEAAMRPVREALGLPGGSVLELVAAVASLRASSPSLERAALFTRHPDTCRCRACWLAGRWQD